MALFYLHTVMVIEIGQVVQDFAVIMIVASAMALISFKLKQPMVIGYIGAGIIIGPYTPPFSFILNVEVLNLFAEIGIILLLFVVGMEFPIEKLRSIGRKAFIIAISEAFGTFLAGYLVGQVALNFSFFDSLFLALAISVTSTVIVMRVLEELNMIKEEASVLILGVAIIEDIIIISMLAILQSVASTGNLSFIDIGFSIGITIAFIAGVLVIGSKTVPKLVDYVSRTNQHDVLVVAMLGVAFGLAFVAYQIGISVAAGAFFAGVLIAESKSHAVTRVLATPLRDMFAALFFVSVGALMDVTLLLLFIVPALVLVAVSLAAKFFTVFLATKYQGFSTLTSLRAGFGLSSSGGELALVVAKGGVDVGVTGSFLLPMVGAMTIITTFMSPYVIKFGWKVAEKLSKK
ncbi:MAG: monovalent cation/proton antiporter-2 family protein [Nitrososphaeraceae archaeon]|nr:monovalent cation/proton antiporter-2 family protein [Nitrososphaeraceae archaeon]